MSGLIIAQGGNVTIASGCIVRTSGIQVDAGGILTLETDVNIKVKTGYLDQPSFVINGTLMASGVTFTKEGESSWGNIAFLGAGSSGSRLENCIIEFSEGANKDLYYNRYSGAVHINDASPTITGCTITNSDIGIDIYAENGGTSPVITNNTISGMTGYGIYIGYLTSPTVTGNTIINNAYGLYPAGSFTITATNNNWGDPTGPLDDSDDRTAGGLYNPGGKGDRVSDHVDYYPWIGMTTEILPGDINNDGVVNLTDAILAFQVSSAINIMVRVYNEADVNGDQNIGLPEMIFILQKASGAR